MHHMPVCACTPFNVYSSCPQILRREFERAARIFARESNPLPLLLEAPALTPYQSRSLAQVEGAAPGHEAQHGTTSGSSNAAGNGPGLTRGAQPGTAGGGGGIHARSPSRGTVGTGADQATPDLLSKAAVAAGKVAAMQAAQEHTHPSQHAQHGHDSDGSAGRVAKGPGGSGGGGAV